MTYVITEVDGIEHADTIHAFNALFADTFPPLLERHLRGYWWLVYKGAYVVGFAGMVPFLPFPRAGYYKRGAILTEHRGKGLQRQLMEVREARARASTDWTHIYSDCRITNLASANNFIRSGFTLVEVEQPWERDALYWRKQL